ncbi:hypothetical protein C8J56DRAFT_396545 [Mycena floridula]|nr:hypothetical protein C8J56DRAFT_396545 [Mycena floridula]
MNSFAMAPRIRISSNPLSFPTFPLFPVKSSLMLRSLSLDVTEFTSSSLALQVAEVVKVARTKEAVKLSDRLLRLSASQSLPKTMSRVALSMTSKPRVVEISLSIQARQFCYPSQCYQAFLGVRVHQGSKFHGLYYLYQDCYSLWHYAFLIGFHFDIFVSSPLFSGLFPEQFPVFSYDQVKRQKFVDLHFKTVNFTFLYSQEPLRCSSVEMVLALSCVNHREQPGTVGHGYIDICHESVLIQLALCLDVQLLIIMFSFYPCR